jgi:glutamyl-tRNA reductase
MVLQMIGVDYENADIHVRSAFAFQHHAVSDILTYIKENMNVSGAVLISTCNRTELYISAAEKITNLKEQMCFLGNASFETYSKYMTEREDTEVVDHLFKLACGMKSKIFGEDQIITQVKNSLTLARESNATDPVLERLFKMAITAAKKVKSTVRLSAVEASVIQELKNVLDKDFDTLKDKKCIVIGNGQIGQLASEFMVKQGALVTVTIRNYKTKKVNVPEGCKIIDYRDRYSILKDFDIIISATTSPHYTIKYSECHHLLEDGRFRVMADLAVPHDISEEFSQNPNIKMYDIDNLGGVNTGIDNEAVVQAENIIEEYKRRFYSDEDVKQYIDVIQAIGEVAGAITYSRIEKDIKSDIENGNDDLESIISDGTKRTITSMLYNLKKHLPKEYWTACIEAFRQDFESK